MRANKLPKGATIQVFSKIGVAMPATQTAMQDKPTLRNAVTLSYADNACPSGVSHLQQGCIVHIHLSGVLPVPQLTCRLEMEMVRQR